MRNFEELFNDSFHRILGQPGAALTFIDHFYEAFMKMPGVAAKFEGTDLQAMKEKVIPSILYLLEFASTRQEDHILFDVAMAHSRHRANIEPSLYDAFTETIIQSVKHFDKEYDDSVALAWIITLAPGLEYMKFHY